MGLCQSITLLRSKAHTVKLLQCCKDGDYDGAEKALEQGADINGTNEDDDIPALVLATYEGHERIVIILLEKGAEITSCDNDGDTALHCAALN